MVAKTKTTRKKSTEVNYDEDNAASERFFGDQVNAVVAKGTPWHRRWTTPQGFTRTAVYSSCTKDGETFTFERSYYFVLNPLPPPVLSVQAFPGCCGIQIITNFGNTPTGGSNPGMTPEIAGKWLDLHLPRKNYVGVLMAALNSDQVEAGFEKILLEKGFEKQCNAWYHPGHGKDISTYAYHCNKPKSK